MAHLVTSFDSIVLAAVARDVAALVGSRVVRVGQPDPDELALELRSAAGARTVVCSIHPQWARVHLAARRTTAAAPSGFAQMLRRRLDAAQLVGVENTPFERILTLTFNTVEGRAELVAEVMGRRSNVILVQEATIAGSLKAVPRSKSSVREVLPGRPYLPPPRDRHSPAELTEDELQAVLSSSDEPLGQRLVATVLGVSPGLATELVARAHLDPLLPSRDQAGGVPRLMAVLRDLVETVTTGAFAPVVYYRGEDPVGYTPFPYTHLAELRAERVASMSAAVETVLGSRGAVARLDAQRGSLLAAVGTAVARVERAEREVRQAVEEARRTGTLRQHGELLLAYASQVPPGASEVTLPGFDDAPVTIALNPALSAVDNAQRLFKRYGRMRAARQALDDRLQAVAAERAYLESAAAMIEQATTMEDLVDLRRELAAEGYLRKPTVPLRASPAAGPRQFALAGGVLALVGRTNKENDVLTFKVAAPGDLWLHARGVPGAHAVIRAGTRRPGEDTLRQAAAIAAYFSKARESASAAVDIVERRFVHKPKGAKPGLVTYSHERTVHVRPALPTGGDA